MRDAIPLAILAGRDVVLPWTLCRQQEAAVEKVRKILLALRLDSVWPKRSLDDLVVIVANRRNSRRAEEIEPLLHKLIQKPGTEQASSSSFEC